MTRMSSMNLDASLDMDGMNNRTFYTVYAMGCESPDGEVYVMKPYYFQNRINSSEQLKIFPNCICDLECYTRSCRCKWWGF